ncbi:MAG TPA: hypothetical protein VFQ35_00570 [Polyangiaceae bacterium]|nr:hypothetical protein [Polyangiaceae bacterium]
MKNLVVGLGFVLAVLLAPVRAEAKGIPIVYNTGQEAFEAGPLPPPFDAVSELAGYKAGYLCDITGVLWSYFSVRNCKPVAFKDDSYADDAEIVKAISAKYTEADMKRGIWARFGWMLMAALVVLGAAVWVYEAVTGKSSDDEDDSTSTGQA